MNDTMAELMLYKVVETCSSSIILGLFHKHSVQNTNYRWALRSALSNIISMLAHKQNTLSALKTVMKDLIIPAKQVLLVIEWDESVKPIMHYLCAQTHSNYMEVIQRFSHPLSNQRFDALPMFEELISNLIAISERDMGATTMVINPDTIANSSIMFATACTHMQ